MAMAARSLDRFPLVRTQSPEEMRAALEIVYTRPVLYLPGRTKKVDTVFNYYPMAAIRLSKVKYGLDLRLAYSDSDLVTQTFPVRGRGVATVDAFVGPLRPGQGIVISSGARVGLTLAANYEALLLLIKTQALTGKLSALTGATIKHPLRFDPVQDGRRPAANALRNHFFFLVDTLSTCDLPLKKAVLAEFEQTLVVMFLHANSHNYSHLLERDVPDAAPRQVRQAEEYMEANAWRAIALEELAEVTGVSALSLFQAFRRTRGYSPSRFLARLRSPLGST